MLQSGAHHLHLKKKRIGKAPRPWGFKQGLDGLMLIIGFVSPIALVPQVMELWTTQNVEGFALLTWAALATANALWTLYGYVHKVYPVMISSAAFSCLQISIVVAILLFR